MLTIATDTLPQSSLAYLAFRAAFRETLERIVLAAQFDEDEADCFGFLTQVPFLRGVPAHVQLDLLSETWRKHVAAQPFEATLVDESVVYAACETTAWLIENEPETVERFLDGGPQEIELGSAFALAEEVRSLHLQLANEGDFLMISQFEDLPPRHARLLKRECGLVESRFEPMFDVLGRWHMSRDFLENLCGLLTNEEIVRAAWDLGVK
jgi:hypothetical protein